MDEKERSNRYTYIYMFYGFYFYVWRISYFNISNICGTFRCNKILNAWIWPTEEHVFAVMNLLGCMKRSQNVGISGLNAQRLLEFKWIFYLNMFFFLFGSFGVSVLAKAKSDTIYGSKRFTVIQIIRVWIINVMRNFQFEPDKLAELRHIMIFAYLIVSCEIVDISWRSNFHTNNNNHCCEPAKDYN